MAVFRLIVPLAFVALSYGGPVVDTEEVYGDLSVDSNEVMDIIPETDAPKLKRDRRLVKGKIRLSIRCKYIQLLMALNIYCTYVITNDIVCMCNSTCCSTSFRLAPQSSLSITSS